MKRPLLAITLFLTFAAWQSATAEIVIPPIRLPALPAPAAPPLGSPIKLSAETLFVVDSDVPFFALCSPDGMVSIVPEAGPLRVRGVFVDGPGKVETRTYKGPHLAIIDAARTGTCELLIVPAGAKGPQDVIRRTLDVDAGIGPRPPPVPPIPPSPVKGLRVILAWESSANNTREQLNILNSTAIVEYLNRKCAKDANGRASWHKWDKDVDVSRESDTWQKLWSSVKPQLGTLPAVVIVSDTKGEVFPLPATEAETLALLKRYGGE